MFPINNLNILVLQEEERLQQMRTINLERRHLRDRSDPFHHTTEEEFICLYRLNKNLARFVFNSIMQQLMQPNNPVAIPVVIKFFASLQFFATGSYQKTIGQNFHIAISQPQISTAISQVVEAIVNRFAHEKIKFPRDGNTKREIKMRFMEATNFPGVIGAIDGTHVAMIKPMEQEHNYFNRKGYHSKNVQIICDFDLKILNINARFGGASHDSFIWNQSIIRTELERSYFAGARNTWLLGDSGYPLQPWLLTPIPDAVPGSPEYRYTQAHIRARNCVERSIGVLKGRFRCLLLERKLRYAPEKVSQIIYACAILHNFCIEARLEVDFEVPEDNINQPIQVYQRIDDDFHDQGRMARQNIINNYFL